MTLPVLIVTGFLGAGKTSLINRLLTGTHGRRIAAIVNDFGAINIDADLIVGRTGDVIGLSNGCICCSLQGDLLRSLKVLLTRPDPPDHVVVEASGIADPHGIVAALLDPVLWASVSLDAVLTVVDAEDCAENLARMVDPLWLAQVERADIVALVKTRSVETGPLACRLRTLTQAPILMPDDEALPLDLILGPGRVTRPHLHRHPITEDRFASLDIENPAPAAMTLFQDAMETLAPGLLRAKGLMNFVELPGRTFLFQMVGRRATLAPYDRPQAGCRLVLIGERGTFIPGDARQVLSESWPGPIE